MIHKAARILVRVMLAGTFLYLLLFAAAWCVLEVPAVQERLRPWMEQKAAAALKADVRVGRISLQIFDRLVLEDVYLSDRRRTPMLQARQIRIGVFSAPTFAWLTEKSRPKHIHASHVEIEGLDLRLYREPGEGTLNIERVFSFSDSTAPRDTSPPHRLLFDFPEVHIVTGRVSYADSTVDSLPRLAATPGRLNFMNMRFDSVQLEAALQFDLDGNVTLDLNKLSARETQSGVSLRHLSTVFEAVTADHPASGQSAVNFWGARLSLGDSDLDFDLQMEGESMGTLFNSGRNRNFRLDFRTSALDFGSLTHFVPADDFPLRGVANVSGVVEGNYKKIRTDRLQVQYGDRTSLNANVRIRDYTDPDRMFMELKLDDSFVATADLRRLLPNVTYPDEVLRIGATNVTGKFTGFLHDFVANAEFNSPLGRVESNLNLKLAKGEQITYSGSLRTVEFKLDNLLATDFCSRLNFDGEVAGAGLSLAEVDLHSRFQMTSTQIVGYEFDTVRGDLTFRQQELTGRVNILDGEGDFEGDVVLNLKDKRPSYTLAGDLRNLDLQHYGVVPQPVRLSAEFNVRLSGDSLDNLSGTADVQTFYLQHFGRQKTLSLEDISLTTGDNTRTGKRIELKSQNLDVSLAGNFEYLGAYELVRGLTEEFSLFLSEDSVAKAAYYAKKQVRDMQFSIDCALHDINPLLDFFALDAFVAPGARFTGNFSFGESEQAAVLVTSDSLRYAEYAGRVVVASCNLDKPAMDNDFLLKAETEGGQWRLSGITLDSVRVKTTLHQYNLDYTLEARQTEARNKLHLNGDAELIGNGFATRIDARESYLMLSDTSWRFTGNNAIRFESPHTLFIDSLRLVSGPRSVQVEADIRPEGSDVLRARLQNFELADVRRLTGLEAPLEGQVNAVVEVAHLFGQPVFRLNGKIERLFFDDVEMGTVLAKSNWVEQANKLEVEGRLIRHSDTVVVLTGVYDLDDEVRPMDFYLTLHRFPLEVVQPFVQDFVFGLEGLAYLKKAHLFGKPTHPQLEGSCTLDARFGLSVLKSYFSVQSTVLLKPDRLEFDRFMVQNCDLRRKKPKANQVAYVNGAIRHSGFQDFQLDLDFDGFNRFQLMNTTKFDNDQFYGSVYLQGGTASLTGTPERIRVTSSKVATGKGTKINIPVTSYTKRRRLEFVTFVGGAEAVEKEAESTFALDLDLDMMLNTDAEMNIIFDEKIGDVMTGRGVSDNMRIIMTPDGDMSMTGRYEITQGDYLFTYLNVVNRRFKVEQGSWLQWTGDPFDAQMDIKATYTVENANLSAWDTTQTSGAKMDVKLFMNGTLQKPQITFKVELPGATQSASFGVTSAISRMNSDPQEMSRQVFSLIVLGSVAPPGRFFGQDAPTSGVNKSMNEFFTNQFNNIVRQSVGENIGISVAYSNKVLVMNVTANFFNNRLTFERNGAITSGRSSDITLGNINLRYRILPGEKKQTVDSGILAAEIFNRENLVTSTISSFTRGVGIFYRKDFDVIRRPKN